MSASPAGSDWALVFAGDDFYAMALAVAMHSTLTKLESIADVYVLDNDLSESFRRRLLKVIRLAGSMHEVRWIRAPKERLGQVAAGSHLTPSTYSRLLIPELLPTHVRRAVYLDADVLVRSDVSRLFKVDLGGSPIGTVRDFLITSTAHQASGVRDRTHARPYFNAGVLVIDVAKWRSSRVAERALEYAASGDSLLWADQDALNAVVQDWCELDFHWNVQPSAGDLFAAERQPTPEAQPRLHHEGGELDHSVYRAARILHFAGPVKPWQYRCTTPGTTSWVRALVRTRWYTPGEVLLWLLRWYGARARYRAGMKRMRYSQLVRRRLGRDGAGRNAV